MKKVLTITFISGLLLSLLFNISHITFANNENKLTHVETELIKENGDKIYKDIKAKKVKPLNPNMEVFDNEGNLVWKGTFEKWKQVEGIIKKQLDGKYKEKGIKAPDKLTSEQKEILKKEKHKK